MGLRLGVLSTAAINDMIIPAATAAGIELAAVASRDTARAEAYAAQHGFARGHGSYEALLDDPGVDLVYISAPNNLHVERTLRAIAAGKHVLVEKPLGVSVEECEELCRRVSASKLTFQVGNNRRFDPGISFARDFVQQEIGQLLSLKAWYWDSVYRYTMTDNLQPVPLTSATSRRPEENPKADKRRYFVLTHASHLVDTARWLGGEIVSVRARLHERFGAFCWFVDVEFANSALGHIDLTVPIRGDFEEGFQIQGENGSVKGRVFLPWYHKTSVVECFSTKDRQYRRPIGEDAFTYKLQLEAFADTILDGAPQRGATVEDGTAVIRALVAIARSVETGERVRPADVSGGV